MDSNDTLQRVGSELTHAFEAKKRVLSYDEYFQLFWDEPHHHARSAAQYLLDVFEHYGSETVRTPSGALTRYRLFDAPFDEGRDALVGQERAQMEIQRILANFNRQRRVNNLILLHGPNGSAKSTIINCMARALVDYSRQDEGAVYTFSWVFPSAKLGKGHFGFDLGEGKKPGELDSFAHLEDDMIDVRLPAELRDHPLLLIPKRRRRELLGERAASLGLGGFTPSEYMLNGDLSPRNRQVFEALLSAYKGDYRKVLAHVRVERFFMSRRYRQGIVTIEPQVHVDAGVRQVTADKSLESLPPSLQNIVLYEAVGDLVDANRGLIEYNDLLKKPVDAFKYLLATCEKSTVTLPTCILYLDLVFIGSSNEKHLAAFKKFPDFQSFKGRIQLVKVPYLVSYRDEQQIYASQVTEQDVRKHIAPHAHEVAALWAVLTRLRRPRPDRFPEELRDAARELDPLSKARLLAEGRAPEGVSSDRRTMLEKAAPDFAAEAQLQEEYEGAHGASPREMKTILLNAVQDEAFSCLSPLAIFAELERLVGDPSVYEFLQVKPDGSYMDHAGFVDRVREHYVELVDEEFQDAIGMVGAGQYMDLLSRYVISASSFVRGEKLRNPITRAYEEPDERFMREVETTLGHTDDEKRKEFREQVLSTLAAYRIDNPDRDVDYAQIFPTFLEKIKDSYFEKQRETVRRYHRHVAAVLKGDAEKLSAADRKRAEDCVATLRERYGYCEACAADALEFLHDQRYR